ncbi:alpha/beta fold hydrolase [Corynebacterium sanguinis]|uniref:Alpha/beta fold hydrolase n=1 Tax=Corynebacterium sanguinis TaxID=2594913 RepID=A0A6C1TVC0_9CORY|nr:MULTISPECIES: alpha/beta fold hydrolase [Corynebacterium]MBA4505069.1 alpha/beta fold hydrolase [Corynebacterium sanguinis]MCT1414345.1 alpha/beta fold hydrolase [Corynebacterium sanguinis]MCT1426688.1 alpha/beta fold hydrolase [Corynebacterium sanguinis]MCT1493352.1 alpha/beta fold hydrolase [Corynebacterium sanguinis]MCT1585393.1 alpha/beta fold hydrolase [Corynebacterium sanguinis]
MNTITTTDGERLAVYAYGDSSRTPLVLVHGYPDDHSVWQRVIPHLTDDFYVVAYDVRGAGESTTPASSDAYTLSQLSHDLATFIDEVLEGRPFHLVGHDWGSIQSWESVTSQEFEGKILSYTSISGPNLDYSALVMRQRASRPLDLARAFAPQWYVGVLYVPFLPTLLWNSITPEKWQKRVAAEENDDTIPVNPNVSDNGRNGSHLYRANFGSRFSSPQPRKPICPVQAIVAVDDKIVHPSLINEMRRWSDDYTQTYVDGGHWAALGNPEGVAEAIASFAKKV